MKNERIMGWIEGLLEAWMDRTRRANWDRTELTPERRRRLVQLFELLDRDWIIFRLADMQDPTDALLLVQLARLAANRPMYAEEGADND